MKESFDFDVDADTEYSVSDGENFEGTKAGWSSQILTATDNHEEYEVVAEYIDWQGNDINTFKDDRFMIGVTEDGDVHRWENGETGPDYGKIIVDSLEPEKSLENREYDWAETADRPSLHQDIDGESPQEVAENYLEKGTSVEVGKLFD